MVEDQIIVYRQLQNIKAVKYSTRRDLFQRLSAGRDYMDLCFEQIISIAEVAQVAMMSEYHFFRLFKKTMGISPHQYLINKRLREASGLLLKDYSVTEAGTLCGFTDIYSFSKAFKKHFGTSPSAYAMAN